MAAVFAECGRRGGIWFLKGHEGWGWRRIVGELRKCLGFLAAEERPLVSSVNAGGGSIRDHSFAAVTSSGSMSQPDFHLDLCLMASWNELGKGGEVARSPVNCFKLETGAPLKKIDTGMGSGSCGDYSSPSRGGDYSGLMACLGLRLRGLKVLLILKWRRLITFEGA
jgi:hypothetical protein